MSLLIKNGKIISPDRQYVGNIFVEGEIIAALENTPETADNIIDATGKLIIPGGIDVHTHLSLPVGNVTTSDDFESGTRAAAFGGTTTIIDFAQQEKGNSLRNALSKRMKEAEKSVIDYGMHMIIVDLPENRIDEIDEMIKCGVTTFKLFTAYPDRLMIGDETILRVLRQTKQVGGLSIVHAEDAVMIDTIIEKYLNEGKIEPKYHALSRPAISEANAVQRVINLAKEANAPVYFVHISCSESLDMIRKAQSQGQEVYAETCPQYLFTSLEDSGKSDFEDAKYIFTPPPREKWNQEKLWDGLKDNSLQVVSTDHCPFNLTIKIVAAKNNFTSIPNGAPGIENRLELLYNFGVMRNRISLQRWIEICCANPAKLFGLYPRKGTIVVGSDADIIIWDPNHEQTISASTHHMNVDHNLYEGWNVKGNANTVISRGEIVIENREWRGKSGRGKFLKRPLKILE